MAGRLKRISGPAHLANAVANIYTPAASTIETVIKQIHVANKTGAAATFTLYIGATGTNVAGTEIALAKSVAANDYTEIFFSPGLMMVSADFLTGLASAAATLTITVMGEQAVV